MNLQQTPSLQMGLCTLMQMWMQMASCILSDFGERMQAMHRALVNAPDKCRETKEKKTRGRDKLGELLN